MTRAKIQTRTVALVGCGKAKVDVPAPARALYTSPLFAKSVALGELVADVVLIASAGRLLVELDEVVAPYDATLSTWAPTARAAWGRELVDRLTARTLGTPTPIRLVLLMGEKYSAPIRDAVTEERKRVPSRWTEPAEPLAGLQVGERLSWLNRALRALRDGQGIVSDSPIDDSCLYPRKVTR